jgi:hypothetical protein
MCSSYGSNGDICITITMKKQIRRLGNTTWKKVFLENSLVPDCASMVISTIIGEMAFVIIIQGPTKSSP